MAGTSPAMTTGSGTRRLTLTVPSASARCGGCACRRPRWRRVPAAGIRRSRRRPAAAQDAERDQVLPPPRSRAPTNNSQFDLKTAAVIGRTVVSPSTRSTQAISARICLSRSVSAWRVIELGVAFGNSTPLRCRRSLPTGTRSRRRRSGCPAVAEIARAGAERVRR